MLCLIYSLHLFLLLIYFKSLQAFSSERRHHGSTDAYLATLSSFRVQNIPPVSQHVKKQAPYPSRPIEEESNNPMMAARSFLDRLQPPPSSHEMTTPKVEAPRTGSYLDCLSERPFQ